MRSDIKNFGLKIKVARIEQKLTQKDLEYISGISSVTISHIENCKITSLYSIIQLADALELSLDYVFDRKKAPTCGNK